MRDFRICHGCGGQVFFAPYWKVQLRKTFVFFHRDCFEFFKRNNAHRVVNAEEVTRD